MILKSGTEKTIWPTTQQRPRDLNSKEIILDLKVDIKVTRPHSERLSCFKREHKKKESNMQLNMLKAFTLAAQSLKELKMGLPKCEN